MPHKASRKSKTGKIDVKNEVRCIRAWAFPLPPSGQKNKEWMHWKLLRGVE